MTAAALALTCGGAVHAELPAPAQALALAFPGTSDQRREFFLTPEQVDQVKKQAGTAPVQRLVVAHEARKGEARVGVAFFDTHTVRTQSETAMVAISPDGKILRVEVVAFAEPKEYQAPAAWVKQLEGKKLDDRLSLKADIHPLSGASLTATALTDAARRCLALWQVLYGGKP